MTVVLVLDELAFFTLEKLFLFNSMVVCSLLLFIHILLQCGGLAASVSVALHSYIRQLDQLAINIATTTYRQKILQSLTPIGCVVGLAVNYH